jgi:hypothetical protein
MSQQFEYDRQLAELDINRRTIKEQEIENRKDKRIKMEGSQQSQMIDQRQNDLLPIDFEQQEPFA